MRVCIEKLKLQKPNIASTTIANDRDCDNKGNSSIRLTIKLQHQTTKTHPFVFASLQSFLVSFQSLLTRWSNASKLKNHHLHSIAKPVFFNISPHRPFSMNWFFLFCDHIHSSRVSLHCFQTSKAFFCVPATQWMLIRRTVTTLFVCVRL